MEKYEKVFESKNIIFIKLSEDLIEEYLTMVNDYNVQKYIRHNIHKYSRDEELNWIKEKLQENAICFSMIEKSSGEYIGNIEIMHIKNNIGELGISITPNKQNMHYGSEAIKAMIEYGFDKLKLSSIDLYVYKDNTRAIHCYENIGFVKIVSDKCTDDFHMIFNM